MGSEAYLVAGLDVGGEVIDVEGFRWGEGIFFDGVQVDFQLRFDRINFIREDGTVEQGEFGIGLKDPRTVDCVGI